MPVPDSLLDGKHRHRAGQLRTARHRQPGHSADAESTVACIPFDHTTTPGFGLPGNAVSYEVYARLTTANETGCAPVTVARPLRSPGDRQSFSENLRALGLDIR